jgi:hypothetical protein
MPINAIISQSHMIEPSMAAYMRPFSTKQRHHNKCKLLNFSCNLTLNLSRSPRLGLKRVSSRPNFSTSGSYLGLESIGVEKAKTIFESSTLFFPDYFQNCTEILTLQKSYNPTRNSTILGRVLLSKKVTIEQGLI